jgi:hypothetical protein
MSFDLGYEKYRDMKLAAVDDEIWVGHNVPREGPQAIAKAVSDVDGYVK